MEALQGDLSQIPVYAIVQMLEIGQKSGVLDVTAPDGSRARLWFSLGRPVHAEFGTVSGFDAAVELARREQGRFRFEPGVNVPSETITKSIQDILLEASRQLASAPR